MVVISKEYTADYFLKKLEPIPAYLWIVEYFKKGIKCCVLGHLGCDSPTFGGCMTQEGNALIDLFKRFCGDPALINNNPCYAIDFGVSREVAEQGPRARILAALRIIQEKGG